MSSTVRTDAPAPGVTRITLARAERRNALDLATMEALVTALRDAEADDEVRAVILAAEDPVFSAGLDLAEVGDGTIDLDAVTEAGDDPWQVLQGMTTPTVAAVNGAAVTGGLELVLCCDLAIASVNARFADTHGRVGIHPSGGMTVLLPRYVGRRAALGMTMTGRFVGAEEAATLGLVNQVVPHEELADAALATATAIAESDARVLGAILATSAALDGVPLTEALPQERARAAEVPLDAAAVESRRAGVIARGRAQQG